MKKSNFLFLCLLPLTAFTQELLTLQQAVEIVLKNNYAIQIAKNETQVAQNDASYRNAGMLPSVTVGASVNWASNDTRQQFSTGTDVDKKDAGSFSTSAGVALNWTIFDGLKMFATYDKLQTLYDMSVTGLKIEVENTVADLTTVYYSLVRQKQLIKAIENSIVLYEERIKIAETKWKIGSASKLDYLQAQVDMNEQKSNLLRQKNTLKELKANLNALLARPADTEFEVENEISISYNPTYDEIKSTVLKGNNQLLLQQQNILAFEYTLKEAKSQRMPRLSLNAAYNYSRTENQAGFILFNQNLGFNAGLTASWTIFNGGNTSRQIRNTEVQLMSSQLYYSDTKAVIESEVLNAYNLFKNAMELLSLEEENFKLAKENVDIALERFKLGNVTSLELKEAQKSFEDAQARLVTARYETKVAETELMRLSGMLVKST